MEDKNTQKEAEYIITAATDSTAEEEAKQNLTNDDTGNSVHREPRLKSEGHSQIGTFPKIFSVT